MWGWGVNGCMMGIRWSRGCLVSSRRRVLVQAAAGGVGLAAIQILKARGADVCATAGVPSKRAILRRDKWFSEPLAHQAAGVTAACIPSSSVTRTLALGEL
jgi:NAD(P)-dependent dehydrogenase (short-subunit alcohol dehydrogenase family)